ncbi:zinc finger, CCHC-type containing protein [Tanacetum coccineum]
MASMNTRLNIKKLDGNIVQKHGGSKQVGFKQLGPSVETRVHGVHDEKRVWFKVELKGAQGDHEAEVFQVSNDDTAVAQRWLEDKQPEEKTNTDCLVKEQEKEYQATWKIKKEIQQHNGLVNETNMTLFANVHCFLIQSGLSKVFWADDTTRSTYLVNRSPSSAIRFKKPIDLLRIFGWLSSIKQGMLEPVKVKCIFLGYHKSIVGNKFWRLDDVTSKVVLYRNMGFNDSGKYKKTFIGSGVGTGSMQVLYGFEFEVEPLGDYTFELARDREQHLACELFGYREDSNEAAFAVATVEKIYAHESLTFNNTVACESTVGRNGVTTNDAIPWEYTHVSSLHLFSLYRRYGFFLADSKAEIRLPRYKLRLVAAIATGALVKGGSRFEVPAQVENAVYWVIESYIKEYLDLVLVPSALMVMFGYHLWLLYRCLNCPHTTIIGFEKNDKKAWMDKTSLSVPLSVLSYNISAAMVLSSICLTLCAIIGAWVANSSSIFQSKLIYGDTSLSTISIKHICLLLCFLLAFSCLVESTRSLIHATYLISIPDSNVPVLGPIPMFATSITMVCMLYFLDNNKEPLHLHQGLEKSMGLWPIEPTINPSLAGVRIDIQHVV